VRDAAFSQPVSHLSDGRGGRAKRAQVALHSRPFAGRDAAGDDELQMDVQTRRAGIDHFHGITLRLIGEASR